MEKIQMDALLAVQTMSQGSRYTTADLAKTDFSRLLKEQNQTSGTKETKKPEKTGQDSVDRADGQVKDSGQKEPADGKTEETDEAKDSETMSAELLLQLQEAAGLITPQLPQETEAAEVTPLEPAVQEPVVEAVSDAPLQDAGQLKDMTPAEPEEALQTETIPGSDAGAWATKEEQAAVQPEQKAPAETVKPAEPQRAQDSQQPSQSISETQEAQESIAPVRAQAETPSENKAKEESQPEQTLAEAVHLQPRSHFPLGAEQTESSTTTVRTTEATLVEDIGRTLAERFPQKDGTLTIELEPASLGKLTIQVLYEAGRATVSILATNPKALELLSQKASELATILEERTGQETIVYTEQPESEQPYDEREREGQQREREQDPEERQNSRAGQESFAQQLRLGLV